MNRFFQAIVKPLPWRILSADFIRAVVTFWNGHPERDRLRGVKTGIGMKKFQKGAGKEAASDQQYE